MTPDFLPDTALLFSIEGIRFALPVSTVERIIRAVAIAPLPDAPPNVLGMINVHGKAIAVLSLRRRIGLNERDIEAEDQFILALVSGRTIALVADCTDGLISLHPEAATEIDAVISGATLIKGILKVGSDLVLLQDLEAFLSPDEQVSLVEALSAREYAADNHPACATR